MPTWDEWLCRLAPLLNGISLTYIVSSGYPAACRPWTLNTSNCAHELPTWLMNRGPLFILALSVLFSLATHRAQRLGWERTAIAIGVALEVSQWAIVVVFSWHAYTRPTTVNSMVAVVLTLLRFGLAFLLHPMCHPSGTPFIERVVRVQALHGQSVLNNWFRPALNNKPKAQPASQAGFQAAMDRKEKVAQIEAMA